MHEAEYLHAPSSYEMKDIIVTEPESGRGRARSRFLLLSALEKFAGTIITKVLRQHLFPIDLVDDGAKVRCLSIREARKLVSARKIKGGVHVFAPSQGENAENPMVMMPLVDLVRMLEDAQEKPSIVDALAPSEDLPVASALEVQVGRRGKGPSLAPSVAQEQ